MALNIDEPVQLSAHDPTWQGEAALEISRLERRLGSPVPKVEHIGSTAVTGLMAKPVIDLLMGIPSLPPAETLRLAIRHAGYEELGEAGVPGRLYFRKRDSLAMNLHVVEYQGTHWKNGIALRELLRADAQARREYEIAKIAAINAGATSLIAYSAAKAPVLSKLISQATAT